MPKIKPFKGIHPSQEFVNQVVLQIENLSIDDAKNIREGNPYSYLNMLVPKIENQYLRGGTQEIIYKKINENFEDFLERGILVKDDEPVIYVYQVSHHELVQTGIWATTSIDDYLKNVIKKHELTRIDREKGLIDYFQQTGIHANPVLITYQPVPKINSIISQIKLKRPELDFLSGSLTHKLWKIADKNLLQETIAAFGDVQNTYIADGHHRAAAASMLGMERRRLNLKHTGYEEYNFFNSVYMATDQLRILEFNRLVKDIAQLSVPEFLKRMSTHFEISFLTGISAFKPRVVHEFGMYLDKNWYKLQAKPHTYEQKDPVSALDVSILQDYLFSSILIILDPRTDSRLSFASGNTSVEISMKKVDQGEYAAYFTLFPASIEQLMQVADAGAVMPPKSTWFEPKFQAGLVIHQVD